MIARRSCCAAFALWALASGVDLSAADRAPTPAQKSPASNSKPAPAPASDPIDFDRQVRPIFAAHCVKCHGPTKEESGLRVDSVTALVQGGYSGPSITPGKSRESILIQVLRGEGDLKAMPPEGPRLKPQEIDLIARWIDTAKLDIAQSAPAKSAAAASTAGTQLKNADHWSFQPLGRPALPALKNQSWAKNPLDAFILAKIEAAGLAPSSEADPATLCRRLYLDLTGLPPSPEEVAAFVRSYSPSLHPSVSPSSKKDGGTERPSDGEKAYQALVEKLLASPHYGERWGRHWLDAARYADSNGYTIDSGRSIWKYRDWVINALNTDMPFDRFSIEQLAGDMLPEATLDQKIATGFHRNTLVNEEGGTDKEQFRVEAVVDRVGTVGTVWLGMTVACARCHDHKYDPISQREFYQLYALLNNCSEPALSFPTEHQSKEEPALLAEIAQVTTRLNDVLKNSPGRQREWERIVRAEIAALEKGESTPEVLDVLDDFTKALDTPEDKRTEEQKKLVDGKFAKNDNERVILEGTLAELNAKHKQLKAKITTTLVVKEMPQPRPAFIHIRGDFLRRGATVEPGTPAVLPAMTPAGERATRLDFARWLVSADNPLTPRVTANRIWQQYFGTGLVATENDFGTQGERPTHPELLDWLARRLVEEKWSLKQFHRLIVTSATYRQSSAMRADVAAKDPYNKLLARQSRIRLEAETIRDSGLAASGLLSREVGGPGVYPPQPEGIYVFTQQRKFWNTTAGPDRFRRGMYTYFWRSSPYPFLMTFDAPDANAACTRRVRSNTPLQALTLANDRAFYEMAEGLGRRIETEGPKDDAGRIAYAFRLCLARAPTKIEAGRLKQFIDHQRKLPAPTQAVAATTDEAPEEPGGAATSSSPAEGRPLIPSSPHPLTKSAEQASPATPATSEPPPAAPTEWTALARVLLNLDEFITRE
jgi:mono/diheme cytochrome c family protein